MVLSCKIQVNYKKTNIAKLIMLGPTPYSMERKQQIIVYGNQFSIVVIIYEK